MPSRRLLTPSVARCAALVAGVGIVLAGCGLDGPTPEPGLSAPEVYARVAPGVGYIETSLGSGTGVLVAPGDPEAFAGAVLRLLADAEAARGLGEAGRRRAEEVFDWNVLADRILEVYEGKAVPPRETSR